MTGRTGGQSRKTIEYSLARERRRLAERSRLSSSDGLGGRLPEARTLMFECTGDTCMASSRLRSPSTTEVKPMLPSTFMNWWRRGLRRSHPTTATRLPAWAKARAMLDSSVVFPSPALALVTWIRFIGRCSDAYWIAVRRPR